MVSKTPAIGTPNMIHRKLSDNLCPHWELLCGSQPTADYSFQSDDLQIIYNRATEPWSDAAEHIHTASDEVYIVLEGAMTLSVEGKVIRVKPSEYLIVPRKERHQLLDVEVPHTSFVIRGPSIRDKTITPADKRTATT